MQAAGKKVVTRGLDLPRYKCIYHYTTTFLSRVFVSYCSHYVDICFLRLTRHFPQSLFVGVDEYDAPSNNTVFTFSAYCF